MHITLPAFAHAEHKVPFCQHPMDLTVAQRLSGILKGSGERSDAIADLWVMLQQFRVNIVCDPVKLPFNSNALHKPACQGSVFFGLL